MSGFIEWLEGLNEKNTKVRAVLQRSLTFDPGQYVPAFPYVEPFVQDPNDIWRWKMCYLVAGLWAAHWAGRTFRSTNIPWDGLQKTVFRKRAVTQY